MSSTPKSDMIVRYATENGIPVAPPVPKCRPLDYMGRQAHKLSSAPYWVNVYSSQMVPGSFFDRRHAGETYRKQGFTHIPTHGYGSRKGAADERRQLERQGLVCLYRVKVKPKLEALR